MSVYPSDSKALGVLLGCQRKLRAFLTVSEQCCLSRVSWWLYHSAGAQTTAHGQLRTADEEVQRLHARLTRGGRSRTKVKLSVAQVRVLLNDLQLVATGIRPSCLVDCCALTKEQVTLLLDFESHWTHIRAVMLEGDVFFVNVEAFIREKMTFGLYYQMYVDVSANLATPQLLSDVTRLQTLSTWTITTCKSLLSAPQVLKLKRPPLLNATALAGILLCYPCTYDILVDTEGATDDWSEQENCLAMCPLYLLQTVAIRSQLELPLQDFSVPQNLLHKRRCFNDGEAAHDIDSLPLLNHLRTLCRLQVQKAIDRSSLDDIQVQVRVSCRTLPRVAL
ncbi:hypothetical protein V7S43_005526 [Phytophthora oleae]|uniref:Uncharacterized protein n=1 Tax=Phytophthora oleae TaxID=2107226 RepID=A0ABD3FT68_9STRA